MKQKNNNKYLFIVWLLLIPVTTYSQQSDWKITSDSSALDIANQVYKWKGNAVFTDQELFISGDEIKEHKSAQGETRLIHITGNPVKLVLNQKSQAREIKLSANMIEYQLDNKHITADRNVLLVHKNTEDDYFEVKGDYLSLPFSPEELMEIKGSQMEVKINQPEQRPLQANANELNYTQKSFQFEIIGDVHLTTGRDNIKAQKILYNSQTRVIQIPKNEEQQAEMTQRVNDKQ